MNFLYSLKKSYKATIFWLIRSKHWPQTYKQSIQTPWHKYSNIICLPSVGNFSSTVRWWSATDDDETILFNKSFVVENCPPRSENNSKQDLQSTIVKVVTYLNAKYHCEYVKHIKAYRPVLGEALL